MKFLLSLLLTGWCLAETIAHTEFTLQGHRVSESEVIIGVTLSPEEDWHTYWSNPGDAGMAPSLNLEEQSLKVELLELPVPKRYELSGLVAYGYGKPVTYLFKVTGNISENLSGIVLWLACDDESCLPGNKDFTLPVSDTATAPAWYTEALAAHPTPLETSVPVGSPMKSDAGWSFSFTTETDVSGWTVFPYDGKFSEIEGATLVQATEATYTFSFKCLGDLPEAPRFLLSDGKTGYVLSL